MKRKFWLIAALILAFAVTLTACEHVHTFEDGWSKDAEYHWHKAICCETDEVSNKAPHTMLPVPGGDREECTVCGYSKAIAKEDPTPTPDPEPEKHVHSYVDGVCSGCGQWISVTDVVLAQASKLGAWNYVVTIRDVAVSHPSLLKGDVVNVNYAELKLQLSANGQIEGYGHADVNYVPANGTAVDAVATVALKDGIAYVSANDGEQFYARLTVEELLDELDIEIDTEELKQAIDELNANTRAVQSYVEELSRIIADLPEQDGGVKWIVDTFLTLNTAKSTADVTVYNVKFDALRALNDVLKTTTVSQYVESSFGKGSYAKIPSVVEELFDVKVGDILDLLEEQGYTVDDVIEMINAVISECYPDEKINTVEQLLASLNVDLQGVGIKEYILLAKPLTPRQMLILAQADVALDQQITVEQIVAKVQSVCDGVKDLTAYDLLLQAAKAELTGGELAQIVEGVIGIAEDGLTAELSFKNNVLQTVNVKFDVDAPAKEPDADADVVATTLWQIRKQLSYFILDGLSIVNGGKLQQDYSAFIAEVIANTNESAE